MKKLINLLRSQLQNSNLGQNPRLLRRIRIFRKSPSYQSTLEILFLTTSATADFEPACIAQLSQVELLRHRQAWLKFRDPPYQIPKFSMCFGIPNCIWSICEKPNRLCNRRILTPKRVLQLALMTFILLLSTSDAKLSLEECQQLALQNSEKINIADLQVLIEKEKVDEAWGLAYPKITAEGNYIAAGEPRRFIRNKKATVKTSLVMPLFNFGGATNSIRAQEAFYESTFYDHDRIQQGIIDAVSQIYFRLLEAQKMEMVVKESIETLREQQRFANDAYSQGLVHKNDVQLVEVQLAGREQDLIQAQHNIAIALTRLNRLIGVQLHCPTEIEDVLEYVAWNRCLESILCDVKRCHPELLSLQTKIRAATYAVEGEKGALYPYVYAFSDYSTTNDYALPYTHGINAGIGVQMNIYDGGVTLAKIRRKKKELLELQYRYRGLEEDIEVNIRSAYLQVEKALNKIPLALKSIKLAKETLKMTQEHYQEGLVTTYDLLNDEERLAMARSSYYQALYDFHRARSELNFASGITQSEF